MMNVNTYPTLSLRLSWRGVELVYEIGIYSEARQHGNPFAPPPLGVSHQPATVDLRPATRVVV